MSSTTAHPPAAVIAPNRFQVQPPPTGHAFIQYSTVAASMDVLQHLLGSWGISPHRLGYLLDIAPGNIYHWKSGRSRISQPMAMKLLKLALLQLDGGLNIKMVREIDWQNGKIYFWDSEKKPRSFKGSESSGNKPDTLKSANRVPTAAAYFRPEGE